MANGNMGKLEIIEKKIKRYRSSFYSCYGVGSILLIVLGLISLNYAKKGDVISSIVVMLFSMFQLTWWVIIGTSYFILEKNYEKEKICK